MATLAAGGHPATVDADTAGDADEDALVLQLPLFLLEVRLRDHLKPMD